MPWLTLRCLGAREEYEERYAKVALVKAQRESERNSALAERSALQTGAWRLRARRGLLGCRTAQLSPRK